MKSVLLSLAALAALSTVALASPEPRCWYGEKSKSCVAFQRTNASNDGGAKAHLDRKGNDVRETDHDRATTRPY